MTFCLGMKTRTGLIGLADTRITSGSEVFMSKKVSTFQRHGYPMFLMTSGLRSVRDKVHTYFEEHLSGNTEHDRLYKAVNAFGAMVKQVHAEDKEALQESNLTFNIHALIGGKLSGDSEPKLYLLYPQGNWVEVTETRPYYIIGESGYGRPVLDRSFKYADPLDWAFKVGCLAFESTRLSAADVDYPMDIVIYEEGQASLREGRLLREDLAELSQWWNDRIRKGVSEIPQDWVAALLQKVQVRSLPPKD